MDITCRIRKSLSSSEYARRSSLLIVIFVPEDSLFDNNSLSAFPLIATASIDDDIKSSHKPIIIVSVTEG